MKPGVTRARGSVQATAREGPACAVTAANGVTCHVTRYGDREHGRPSEPMYRGTQISAVYAVTRYVARNVHPPACRPSLAVLAPACRPPPAVGLPDVARRRDSRRVPVHRTVRKLACGLRQRDGQGKRGRPRQWPRRLPARPHCAAPAAAEAIVPGALPGSFAMRSLTIPAAAHFFCRWGGGGEGSPSQPIPAPSSKSMTPIHAAPRRVADSPRKRRVFPPQPPLRKKD